MAQIPMNEGHLVEADDGMFFGLGAFETIAVENGRPALLPWHAQRMAEALQFLGIRPPDNANDLAGEESGNGRESRHVGGDDGSEWSAARCLALMERACVESVCVPAGGAEPAVPAAGPGMAGGRRVVKVTVTARNVMVSRRPNPYDDAARRRGFSCRISMVRRNETSPFTLRKTLNYGECILEKRAARRDGVDEPLFLNSRGLVTEGATSTVFAVFNGTSGHTGSADGVVATPPVSDGLLPGIMRRYVMNGWCVDERSLTLDELMEAREVFVTNSLMPAMPVRTLCDEQGRVLRTYPDSRYAHAITKRYMSEVAGLSASA